MSYFAAGAIIRVEQAPPATSRKLAPHQASSAAVTDFSEIPKHSRLILDTKHAISPYGMYVVYASNLESLYGRIK